MLKSFFILNLLLISTLTFADNFEKIKKSGVIKIAVDSTYPPMEFESDSGELIGLDIDLANELSKLLKLKTEFVVMPWDGILAGLLSNRYDIIMSSMNVTPDRALRVNFVPYLLMGQVFVTKTNGPVIKNEKDLKQKVIAVQSDTTSHEAVLNFKKNIAIKEIKSFKGATEAFSALHVGHADVIVIDEAVGLYYTKLDSSKFKISGNALMPEPIGIAVKKEDQKLLLELKNALKTLIKNKQFHRIYKKWLNREPSVLEMYKGV